MQLFPLGERLWHKNGVSSRSKTDRPRRPLNAVSLNELALATGQHFRTHGRASNLMRARSGTQMGWRKQSDFDSVSQFAESAGVDVTALPKTSRAFEQPQRGAPGHESCAMWA
jgi:hypothetical protein